MRRFETVAAAMALVPALLLGGCAAPPPPVGPPLAREVRTYRDNLEVSGRISVRYQRERKEEALHGSFQWHQVGGQVDIVLSSPLGQTIAEIAVTPELATLTQSGLPPRTAAGIDALSAEVLGWPLPVAGLRAWLQGFAMDAQGRPVVADALHPEISTADGWHIRYVGWHPDASPKRIDLRRGGPGPGAEVSLRIIVEQSNGQAGKDEQ